MLKFAVCDDEEEMTEFVSDKLREYYPDICEIRKYTDGNSLLADSRRERFDALFLDVGMPSPDGMEIAEKIRKKDSRIKIIFVSNKEELAYMGYKYGAFRYVRKRELERDLRETAESLNKFFNSADEFVSFKTPTGGEITRSVKNIVYFKVKGHYLTLFDPEEEEICGTMNELEELVMHKGFIRIHKSYLVNFRYISSLEPKTIKLSSGKELPLSRVRIDETRKRLHEYINRSLNYDGL